MAVIQMKEIWKAPDGEPTSIMLNLDQPKQLIASGANCVPPVSHLLPIYVKESTSLEQGRGKGPRKSE